MLRLLLVFVFGLAFAGASRGQGTFLFTWHGDSNFFQASFEVTQADLQPGNKLSDSPVFLASLSITNPDGRTYHYVAGSANILGGLNPWAFGVNLFDFGRGTELLMSGGEPPAMAGLIHEKPLSGADTWYEPGYWTDSQIPEPSAAMLSGIAVLCLAFKRGRAGTNRPSRNRV